MKPNFISEDEFAAMAKRVGFVEQLEAKRVQGGVDNDTQGTPKGMAQNSRQRGASKATTQLGIRSAKIAGSNPAPAPYRSKWEAAYASKLELEKHAGIIKAWWYEPFSLWLPGKVRYKPDFLIEMPYIPGMERHLEIIEVKGWSKNKRDGMTRLKIAAALFPCFVWRMVYRTKGGGWDGLYL